MTVLHEQILSNCNTFPNHHNAHFNNDKDSAIWEIMRNGYLNLKQSIEVIWDEVTISKTETFTFKYPFINSAFLKLPALGSH